MTDFVFNMYGTSDARFGVYATSIPITIPDGEYLSTEEGEYMSEEDTITNFLTEE